MNDAQSHGYRVRVLHAPEFDAHGIAFQEGEDRELLEWRSVKRVLVAEVGEPEGVRTIVFELIVEDGPSWLTYRLGVDPADDAAEIARELAAGLGPDGAADSVKSVAADGTPTQWYPDLESFEQAVVEERGRL